MSVDVDQFLVVKLFGLSSPYSINIAFSSYSTFNYLPREFFNMAKVIYINFGLINSTGYNYYYCTDSKPYNHNFCSWSNFTKLNNYDNLYPMPDKNNKHILQILESL